MIVVADSGSTKTAWRLCTAQKVVDSTSTKGLNPLALDKGSTIAELRNSALNGWLKQGVLEVYFYGAGLIDDKQREVAASNLNLFFNDARVTVNSDLLGAARAVFGDSEGVIGILGTGSNTGLYDGKNIVRNIPALGYILADEGSGSVLGRVLLKHFLRDELPTHLSEELKSFYPAYASLIPTIYAEKHAARFLASFVPFIYEQKEDPFIQELLHTELKCFVNLISKYPARYKTGIVGSVGFQFQKELNLLAQSAGLNIVDYLKNPIDKLALYHQNKIS
jgi:glucosamine kinase